MTRAELETMLGKEVEGTLIDKTKYTGILRKTRVESFKDNPNLFYPLRYYFLTDANQCNSVLFRTSHVMKCKVIK